MPSVVYSLCAATSILCMVLLLIRYRRRRERLLLWTAVCFCGLALNNLLLAIDYILVPTFDMAVARSVAAAAGLFVLLAGLIWEG